MEIAVAALVLLSILLAGLLGHTFLKLRALRERFRPVVDLEAERKRVEDELKRAKSEAEKALAAEQKRVESELKHAKSEAEKTLAAEQKRVEDELKRARDELTRAKSEAEKTLAAEQKRVEGELKRARDDADKAVRDAETRRQQASSQRAQLEAGIARLTEEFQALEEEAVLRSYGFYKPIYNFSSSDKYEQRLEDIRERQKSMLKDKKAASCNIQWEVNGSKAEGKKQIDRTLKLMLRAFNGEADACVAKVTYKNVKAMEARIDKSADAINGLAEIQQCFIAKEYVNLKLDELHLAHEYQEKLQEEREEQRRIREQMREEEAAQRELERARLEVERESRRDEEALRKARTELEKAEGSKQQKLLERIAELERKVAEDQERQRSISQAQLTRTGHVYVISNVGSFGEDVFKVGMTRRLVPQDRIDELGDASVPFEFDVHAIIRTQDAPALETALHRAFAHRRVNRINERKEFFRVTLDEIAEAVRKNHGDFELTRVAEAAEYRKTLALVEEERRTGAGNKAATPRAERAVA
jgi:hypothetical protein